MMIELRTESSLISILTNYNVAENCILVGTKRITVKDVYGSEQVHPFKWTWSFF